MDGSIYLLEIRADGATDLIKVSGKTIIHDAYIRTYLPRSLYTDGTSWRILTSSGGIHGNFSAVDQPNSVVLSLASVNLGNYMDLVLSRKSYGAFADSPSAAQVGRGMDSLVPVASGNMETLLLSMDWDMNASQIANVLNQLNPEMYTAFTTASFATGSMFSDVLSRRLEEMRQRKAFSLDPQKSATGPVPAGRGRDHAHG